MDFALVRYNVDGSLDGTFGSGGIVTTPIQAYAHCYAVATQADGKIVTGGASVASSQVPTDFSLARYHP